jgi:hypothetical protein
MTKTTTQRTIPPTGDHERSFAQLDAFLDQDMDADESTTIAAHIAECETCWQHLVELRGVEKIYMDTLAKGGPTPEYRAHLMEELRTTKDVRRKTKA